MAWIHFGYILDKYWIHFGIQLVYGWYTKIMRILYACLLYINKISVRGIQKIAHDY